MKKVIKNNLFLLKQVWKYSKSFVLILTISSITGIYSPIVNVWFLKKLVDSLVNGTDIKEFITIIIAMSLAQGLLMLYNYILNEWFVPMKSEKVSLALNKEYMEKLHKLDISCFDNTDFYNNYTRSVGEISARPLNVLFSFTRFLTNLFSIVTLITLMITMDPVSIVFSIVNVLFSIFWETKKNQKHYLFSLEKTYHERRKGHIFSLFWGNTYAKEIKSSKIVELLKSHYAESGNSLLDMCKHFYKKLFATNSCLAFTNMLSFGITYLYIGLLAFLGKITIGSLSGLLSAVGDLTGNIAQILNFIPEFHKNSLYTENLKLITDYEPEIEKNEGEIITEVNSIEFKNVTFSYPFTEKIILEDVSFKINKDQKIALVGQNGAGKSTILKLICRFYDPQNGSILINGKNIKEYNVYSLRELYSTVFQDYKAFSVSIGENVLHKKIDGTNDVELINNALEQVGLAEKVNEFNSGIYTNVSKEFDDTGIVFSGGELQRLCIARAIANNSQVIVMDEPSSALDPIAESKLLDTLNKMSENRLTFLVTHRLSNVCNVDEILLLNNGRIEERGTHEDLISSNGKYAKMFKLQAQNYKKIPMNTMWEEVNESNNTEQL